MLKRPPSPHSPHRLALAMLSGLLVAALIALRPAPVTGHLVHRSDGWLTRQLAPPAEAHEPLEHHYQVKPGDTLGGIFGDLGVDRAALRGVLAADTELLALDVLHPGQQLRFTFDSDHRTLAQLTLILHPGHRIHYHRATASVFEFEEEVQPTYWRQQTYAGVIQGTFYQTARHAGLRDRDIIEAQRIFDERINFRRDLRAGDTFALVLGSEFTESDEPTGRRRIEGVRLLARGTAHNAFLHDDGNYYDSHGESLNRAFLRYPTVARYRISSPFNLRRKHPVTGRIAPHHGVDFATPIGTPILSTGDGVVTRVGNHPFAGKYVEIEHHGAFKTRYLHLDRILVARGQQVSRGDRIALSGNTGRSTGPHLHFELHVNNRPVDPMTADIPMAQRLADSELDAFRQRAAQLAARLDRSDLRLAQQQMRSAPPGT
ncbi:peptidoglycan DD-metalloendopeptidase family protein [Isoalcanivorax indicus]|uniref:peptidoglycan DD-metalloendopeptidase family protein n=1 Tax=Isoalcanivorax indicus TaxID=2202653 RepID=UPI000DBA5620|nr:peptidoglycan DD-metalloendopeptidase family protein [Isoalcanivorax indicus]